MKIEKRSLLQSRPDEDSVIMPSAIKSALLLTSIHVSFVENGERKKQLSSTKWIVRKNLKYKNGVNKLKRNSMTGMTDEMNS